MLPICACHAASIDQRYNGRGQTIDPCSACAWPAGGGALAPILQTRLMDVAGEAQTLAAALNHSAFNVANALGPLLGGIAIAQGFGLASTGLVGSGLALAGLMIWAVALKIRHQ